eukprot:gene28957-38306_t
MLAGLLPAPKNAFAPRVDAPDSIQKEVQPPPSSSQLRVREIPSYPYRKGFVPIEPQDFGDGGAYPEIHVVQYPLNMGRPGHKSSALVAVSLDSSGSIQTDMIVKQGTNKNKLVQSKMDDIREK